MRYLIILIVSLSLYGCNKESKSSSGVSKATATIKTGVDGLTVEQRNVKKRLESDNKIGSIKHLYVISAYSGQTIIYSTVKGKVTSSGKRLSPGSVASDSRTTGMMVEINGRRFSTPEVIQDNGTYGSSINYLYWWDVQGRYHQHYVSGGQIIHISDKPLLVKGIIINMELTKSTKIK